jgi:hypothetical protein
VAEADHLARELCQLSGRHLRLSRIHRKGTGRRLNPSLTREGVPVKDRIAAEEDPPI